MYKMYFLCIESTFDVYKVLLLRGGGDIEECNYADGIKHGKAIYFWKAGHK